MGEQPLSRRPSAPSFSFGNCNRQMVEKVSLSKEHAKLAGTFESPGPAYSLGSSVGTQVEGRRTTAPAVRFGTSERFPRPKTTGGVPGPASYPAKGTFGRQVSGRSAAAYGFGTSERQHTAKIFISEEHAKVNGSSDAPAPIYKVPGSFGRQNESKKVSTSAPESIGSDTPATSRPGAFCGHSAQLSTVRVGACPSAWARRGLPPCSRPACREHPTSLVTRRPAFALGTQKRFQYEYVKRAANTPGPGQYESHGVAVGPQFSSTYHSSSSFGFGTSNREQPS